MSRLKVLVGLAIATLPDVGSGLLAAYIASKIFPSLLLPFPLPLLYLAGIIFAILPDFDALPGLVLGKSVAGHKAGLHYPALLLPPSSLLLLVHPALGLTAIAGLFLHFAHDSVGSSEGVRWLWPFGRTVYRFSLMRGVCASTEAETNTDLEPWIAEFFNISRLSKEAWLGLGYFSAIITFVAASHLFH